MAGVITKSPFRSEYGFDSPGFTVDDQGNITATSISLQQGGTDTGTGDTLADFTVTPNDELNPTGFTFENYENDNPIIELRRGKSYIFDLDTDGLAFYFTEEDQTSLFSNGLVHSDGSTGLDAQGKNTGLLSFNVPNNAPDLLFYGDITAGIFGRINIQDPDGRFGELLVTDQTDATSSTTGALQVTGGASIGEDLYVGQSINIDGTGIPNFYSSTNLELEAMNEIVIKVDNSKLGFIGSSGSTVPLVNTTINNTVIGNITPASAAFSDATVNNVDVTEQNSITNKTYVDTTALAFSITFGL